MLHLLLDLPVEVQLIILSALSPEDMMSLASSCKALNEVTRHESLWEKKCKQHFPYEITQKKATVNWYHFFKETYITTYNGLSKTQRRLFSAVKEEEIPYLKKLHEQKLLTEEVLYTRTQNGGTILHVAAQQGCCKVLTTLAQFRLSVNFNVTDYNGKTPAHYAAARGQLEALNTLHALGVDIVNVINMAIHLLIWQQ